MRRCQWHSKRMHEFISQLSELSTTTTHLPPTTLEGTSISIFQTLCDLYLCQARPMPTLSYQYHGLATTFNSVSLKTSQHCIWHPILSVSWARCDAQQPIFQNLPGMHKQLEPRIQILHPKYDIRQSISKARIWNIKLWPTRLSNTGNLSILSAYNIEFWARWARRSTVHHLNSLAFRTLDWTLVDHGGQHDMGNLSSLHTIFNSPSFESSSDVLDRP